MTIEKQKCDCDNNLFEILMNFDKEHIEARCSKCKKQWAILNFEGE